MNVPNEFRQALSARLERACGSAGIPDAAIGTLCHALTDDHRNTNIPAEPNPLPQVFDAAVANALESCGTDLDRRLVRALHGVADHLAWFRRPSDPGSLFHRGHANAEIFGRRGIGHVSGVTVGLTVMAPETEYPDHHHPPDEVYLVLSPGAWRQNDAPWWEPGFGGYVYNPPDIIHAMRSAKGPLLAIWCLRHQAD